MINSSFSFLDETVPLLALSIHSGHQLCPLLTEHTGISEADRFREEDPFTDQIASSFANHITLDTSRFVIDLNRMRQKALYLKPEDCWGLPVMREGLAADVIEELLADYDRWYRHLDEAVNRLLKKHRFIVVLDLHSYNHRRGGPDAKPDPQIDNPDIILGRNNMHSKYYPEVEKLRALLDGQSYMGQKLDCRCDVKFPGGHLSRYLNGKFEGRLFCLAIEFKKIFMDEWSGEQDHAAFRELKTTFQPAVQKWLGLLDL